MRRPFLLAAFLLAAPLAAQRPTAADEAEKPAVLAVVKKLFDAMRSGDSASARSVFAANATLMTINTRGPQPAVTVDSLGAFVRIVGTPRPQVLDERTFEETVLVQGNIAQAWTPYVLFLDDRFIHCGVDAFTMAKMADGWKIISLADTRTRTGCVPERMKK